MHSIRCAHCKGTHCTVAEVRACSTPPEEQPAETRADSLPTVEMVPGTQVPLHDTPCVCSVYNRCNGVRLADARDAAPYGATAVFRARHRAYND